MIKSMTRILVMPALALAAMSLVPASAPAATDVIEVPIGFPIDVCGTVVPDKICGQLLQADNGSYYGFNGIDQLQVGDRVRVEGDVCLICLLMACEHPWSALMSAKISDCVPWQPVLFDECVTVLDDPNCGIVIQSDKSGPMMIGNWPKDAPTSGQVRLVGEVGPITLPAKCPGADGVDYPFSALQILFVSGCNGDLNIDGAVNGVDLGIMLSAWGECPGDDGVCPADLNADGRVDGVDLGSLLSHWQR